MDFSVSIGVFEGPFDLLLQLILKNEVSIYSVPIARITDDYLKHLEIAQVVDLDSATEFILIASTLLLIKASSLIPAEEGEELIEAENAREFLVDRLTEYKKFSDIAAEFERIYEREGCFAPTMRELETDYSALYPDPFDGITVDILSETIIELFSKRALRKVDTSHIAPIRVSIEEKMVAVRKAISKSKRIKFSDVVQGCDSKIELIAFFLAILELYKEKEIEIKQKKLFGEIEIIDSSLQEPAIFTS
ncbi:MAG: segregation/condensation protein A [Actinomycetota bacterium]|nr:segregation/condensation protein A [Actinomycetota bacterium]